tara:strand:+ start:3418 stop:3621 length:204 start_codon:yes stop_codon:yes gene_type:complete
MKVNDFFSDSNNLIAFGYYMLIPVGLAFWVAWYMEYSVWKDIGLYAVLVVMFLLAFFGSLTYGKARR